jgi:dynein heavy chain
MRSGEKEFIISPLFGAMVIQTLTNKNMTEHKHWTAKKPFDWMSDEQFVNLQVCFYLFLKCFFQP